MEALYSRLADGGALPHEEATALWKRWLWGCDPNAVPMERCFDLNEMHALGLLVCLQERAVPVPEYTQPIGPEGPLPILYLHPTQPVSSLSLRETLDQLECLQLHWGPVLAECGHSEALGMVRALMARLGELAQNAYPFTRQEEEGEDEQEQRREAVILDDPQHITPLPATMDTVRPLAVLSHKSLRQAICVLFALLRVHHIVSQATELGPGGGERAVVVALRTHHIEASQDLFDTLQQMVHLAPGQRLAYRTQFSGMYNSVSQVVYFHNPRFCRQPQLELSQLPSSPMHMLPLVMQLLPEIPLCYDDDSALPGLTSPPRWAWLASCGRFFLLDDGGRVLWAPELAPLVAHYLRATGRSISAADDGHEEEEGRSRAQPQQAAMAFGHVQLLSSTEAGI